MILDIKKIADAKKLYDIFMQEFYFYFEGLDCYKENKCNYTCRLQDDGDLRDCWFVRRVCEDFYKVEFDKIRFVEYEDPIISFYQMMKDSIRS